MTESDDEIFTSLKKAADYAHVTRQAIFLAIKKNQLKAQKSKIKGQIYWIIKRSDLDEYRSTKYNREKRLFEGEHIISLEKDKWSVLHASKTLAHMLGRPYQTAHIYYLLRTGQLRGFKRGGMWVLSPLDVKELYRKEMGLFLEEKSS